MAYADTYSAYAEFADGSPRMEWRGLTKGQARWRYHWIARQYYNNPKFNRMDTWGWEREWLA